MRDKFSERKNPVTRFFFLDVDEPIPFFVCASEASKLCSFLHFIERRIDKHHDNEMGEAVNWRLRAKCITATPYTKLAGDKVFLLLCLVHQLQRWMRPMVSRVAFQPKIFSTSILLFQIFNLECRWHRLGAINCAL